MFSAKWKLSQNCLEANIKWRKNITCRCAQVLKFLEPLAWLLFRGKHAVWRRSGTIWYQQAFVTIPGFICIYYWQRGRDGQKTFDKTTMSMTRVTEEEKKNHEKYFRNTAPTHFQRRRAGTVRVGDQNKRAGMGFPPWVRPLTQQSHDSGTNN